MVENNDVRIERDTVGEIEVPADAYYGVNAMRADENFNITGRPVDENMIMGIVQVKKASALMNAEAGQMEDEKAEAIAKVCDEIIEGKHHDHFITDAIQGGAGTSMNMNANEVIANRASEVLGGEIGDHDIVHPNDDVNMGQSTNDVIPTAGKIAIIHYLEDLYEELEALKNAYADKAKEFDKVVKMGRTHMQDAIPVRLGQEFNAFSNAIGRNIDRIKHAEKELHVINMGSTAVGTGLNADTDYYKGISDKVAEVTGIDFEQGEDLFDSTSNLDPFVSVHGTLKALAVTLSKQMNDLRLMASGPRVGLNEINLEPRQNGSSIMPGKVNPVILEVVNQVAFRVIGNDVTVTAAAEGGQFQLNVFEPVLFYATFESLNALIGGVNTLTENSVKTIEANEEVCQGYVDNSVGTITALTPHIGYDKASEIADKAIHGGESVREQVLDQGLLTEEELDNVLDPFAMTEPGIASKE